MPIVFASAMACSTQAGTTQSSAIDQILILPGRDQDAAGNLQAEMRCDEQQLRKAIARLSWTVAANQGSEQRVAVTIYRDGFETGNYEISEPLPPYQSSLVWDRLKGQAIHLWRVLTLQDEGWVPSVTERFEGMSCVADFVLPPKSSKLRRPMKYDCAPSAVVGVGRQR